MRGARTRVKPRGWMRERSVDPSQMVISIVVAVIRHYVETYDPWVAKLLPRAEAGDMIFMRLTSHNAQIRRS